MTTVPDPFDERRKRDGVLPVVVDGETIPMLLRHEEVRRAAKDSATYSSDAPFRVPIPSEERLRHDRQLPIETDPPAHTAYRALVEPWFLRAREPAYAARIAGIVRRLLAASLARDAVEVVGELALPLQSRALAVLLGVDEAEADRWIAWGVHVFHGADGEAKAAALDAYLHERFDRAAEIRLERRPNPHVSFGFGPHLCLGAAHSRTLVRGLLEAICDLVGRIDVVDAVPRVETTASHERPLGYERLICRFTGTSS